MFLSESGRCRIHERFGAEAKPLVCRMFPYQTVALDQFAYLTLRRNCPSVVRHEGKSLAEQEEEWRSLVEHSRLRPRLGIPPPITVGYRGSWKQFLRAAGVVERLICDQSYPMVRRLVHALLFAQTLDACRLSRLTVEQYIELLHMLEESAPKEAAVLFQEKAEPDRASQFIFRRILIDYLRLHPGFPVDESWTGRFRWIKTVWAIARGKGGIPGLAPPNEALRLAKAEGDNKVGASPRPASVSLSELNRKFGGLHRDVMRPLDEYFEMMVLSRRFAVTSRRGWALTDRVRALAASFSVALALLRLATPGRPPTTDDMTAVVITLDRGEGAAPLTGPVCRRRLRALGRTGQLIRHVIWWAQ